MPRPPLSRSVNPPFQPPPPKEISAWLERYQLHHLRCLSIASLEPRLPSQFAASYGLYQLAHQSLIALMEGTLELPANLSGSAHTALLKAAWDLVHQETEAVRQGLELERLAVPRPLPRDERLRLLHQVLEQERARLRTCAVPRVLPPERRLLFFPEDTSLPMHFEEPGLRVYYSHGSAGLYAHSPVRVHLYLLRLLEQQPGLHCTCNASVLPATCPHALSAVDELLATLADPSRGMAHSRLIERLFELPAKNLLEGLAAAALSPAQGEPPHLTFRLEILHGMPRLRPFLHKPLKRGGLSRGTPLSSHEWGRTALALSSPQELEALELCRLMENRAASTTSSTSSIDAWLLLLRTLKLLSGSPRLVLGLQPDRPLQVREASLGLALLDDEQGLRLRLQVEGAAVAAHELLSPGSGQPGRPWLWVEPGVPRVNLVSVPAGAGKLISAMAVHGSRLPASARLWLLEHLGSMEARLPLSLPASLEGRELQPEPTLLLRLHLNEDQVLEGTLLVQPLAEALPQPPGAGPEVLRALRGTERVRVQRQLEAERQQAAALFARLELQPPSDLSRFTLRAEHALELLERLEPLSSPGLRVQWAEQPPQVVRSREGARGLKLKVRRTRDWFGVGGQLTVGGEEVELGVLLEALRRGVRYVPLTGQRWLRLSESLREHLALLADLTHSSRHGLEVSVAAAPALEALQAAGAKVQAPPDWQQLSARLREAQAHPAPVPPGLKARLREYQREGFEWMARLAAWSGGGCLADDMGLGKTVQTLALLLHRAPGGPALVLAPTSVCPNWVAEAQRFAPSLRVRLFREPQEREAVLAELRPGDVVITSYGLLTLNVERFQQLRFATLVLDEAQAVKNPDTARAQAARRLQADMRLALSGTPVENRLSELWSLFHLIFPGLLGSRESFRKRFVLPVERDNSAQARAALARVVRPFLLRRTKAEVARELPPRVESVVPVALSEQERRVYESVRRAALLAVQGVEGPQGRIAVLAALTRLRLAACHARLVDSSAPARSSKLERLLELVESLGAAGSRALIFSQFVQHLALVREALQARGVALQYLDGSTPPAERQARVEAFQRGEGTVFLISLRAGGTGLNLTGADHVLHLDPWWNPAVEDQATDRAHRIGQSRPVTVLRLVAEGTIEEAILALHAQKRELAEQLLAGADGAAALSLEELLALLRFGADGG